MPTQGSHLGGEPRPDPFHGRLARLDQQLAAVAPDVEPQKVHPALLTELVGEFRQVVRGGGRVPANLPA
jgi:hypothetical protein